MPEQVVHPGLGLQILVYAVRPARRPLGARRAPHHRHSPRRTTSAVRDELPHPAPRAAGLGPGVAPSWMTGSEFDDWPVVPRQSSNEGTADEQGCSRRPRGWSVGPLYRGSRPTREQPTNKGAVGGPGVVGWCAVSRQWFNEGAVGAHGCSRRPGVVRLVGCRAGCGSSSVGRRSEGRRARSAGRWCGHRMQQLRLRTPGPGNWWAAGCGSSAFNAGSAWGVGGRLGAELRFAQVQGVMRRLWALTASETSVRALASGVYVLGTAISTYSWRPMVVKMTPLAASLAYQPTPLTSKH